MKTKIVFKRAIITILVAVLAFTMIIPFLWMLSASFKINAEVMELPIKWIPRTFTIENYKKV